MSTESGSDSSFGDIQSESSSLQESPGSSPMESTWYVGLDGGLKMAKRSLPVKKDGMSSKKQKVERDPVVAQGSDPMVEPALDSCAGIAQDVFLDDQFKKVAEISTQRLKEPPVNVDGSGIRKLLSNSFELDKALDLALQTIPKDHHHMISKTNLRIALDTLGPSAKLPPLGAVDEIDKIIVEELTMMKADDGKSVMVDEFKKLLTELLGSIMLRLEGSPIAVSLNSVVRRS